MNRQRLLTMAVAANAILTIVALIRIYTVSNVIQSNLAALSGSLLQLSRDVATLHDQVQRMSSSVSSLTDDGLKAVQTTVTHLDGNLTALDNSVASLQGFTKDQLQDHGALSQSINSFANTLQSTGAEVQARSTAEGGLVQTALDAYRRNLADAAAWTTRQNTDPENGLVRTALTRYAGTLDSAGHAATDATQEYRKDLETAAQQVIRAGAPGGTIADAQSAYSKALAAASAKASEQVRDRLDKFFQDNQPALSKELLKKIDARVQCTCGPASSPVSAGTAKASATHSTP